MPRTRRLVPLAAFFLVSCGRATAGQCRGDDCGTLVFAAIGEPTTLNPAVSDEALDRDIEGQLFLKLADIGPDLNTVGEAGFEKQLADHWSWTDSLTLAFHMDPRARWHDGRPVTARDVAFTYAAVMDTATGSPARESLGRIASVTAADSATAVFRFRERYPEMFYDAVYGLRVLPEHILGTLPHGSWRSADFGRHPVGDGPYRFVAWTAGQSLELAADSTFFMGRPHLRRLVWRFAADPNVAVTQLVAGEADAIEILVPPPNIDRAKAAPRLKLYPYPGSAYTIMGFNLRRPVLADPVVRRAIVFATDRERMARSVFGAYAKVPPAPIPQQWTALWFKDLPVPRYDTAYASHLLDSAGWRRGPDGVRVKGGRRLAFAISVPSTSASRKQYAQLIQEQLRAVGIAASIEQSDMSTLQQHLHSGAYDAAIQTWTNDPTPSSGIPQAWRRGGSSNFSHYDSPAFEHQLDLAAHAASPGDALHAWHAAFEILAQDAPAVVLNAPDNIAAIDQRVSDVRIRPDEYWAYVRSWRIPRDRMIDRDRLGR
jgi:peptide/nickel transport system substrate-binding protein